MLHEWLPLARALLNKLRGNLSRAQQMKRLGFMQEPPVSCSLEMCSLAKRLDKVLTGICTDWQIFSLSSSAGDDLDYGEFKSKLHGARQNEINQPRRWK